MSEEKKKFDEAAFDAAVAKPNGWSGVADPVAEVRKMRDGDEPSWVPMERKRRVAPGNAADSAWANICAACAEGTPPKRCAYYGDPNGCNAPTLGKHPEGDLAERLQEALEKAERRVAELERTPGNAAALREALEKIKKLNRYDLGCIRSKKRRDEFDSRILDIEKTVRAALAAPARNADRFATAEEARTAFLCDARNTEGLDHLVRLTEIVGRVCDWLFDKAKGKETDNG